MFACRRLRQLVPDFIVSQPTYGYPQIQAEIDVINASWNPGGATNRLADSIGELFAFCYDRILNESKSFHSTRSFRISQ